LNIRKEALKLDKLWSYSTTIRNPERLASFFKIISTLDGQEWNKENQVKLQILLIQHKLYKPTNTGLSAIQISLLEDPESEITFEKAKEIFLAKEYEDPPMRGRTSFDPVEKTGLVNIINGKINISEVGKSFLRNEIDLSDVLLISLLKYQLPNPLVKGFVGYNTKPFINTIKVINKVNQICLNKGLKEKGISREEFGIFVLSLKDYRDVDVIANEIIKFRQNKDSLKTEKEKKIFVRDFIINYLKNYQDPLKNVYEYSDNMIRILRLTKFFYLRGNGFYIDLEKRRSFEIIKLLETDNGSAKSFSKVEWLSYMSDKEAYELPWEKIEDLIIIRKAVIDEIVELETKLQIQPSTYKLIFTKKDVLNQIQELRAIRANLLSEQLKIDLRDKANIEKVVSDLSNIRQLNEKASIELERLATEALMIINDAVSIKPNYPVGDDNKPTFTAPSKVPDIECFYNDFKSICEVTMLTNRDQWFNEGQPVMRHLRDFEERHKNYQCFCLFVAPKIHTDTLNTFWNSVKYEYQGERQKIIPITISQLIKLLVHFKSHNQSGNKNSNKLKGIFEDCCSIEDVKSSLEWKKKIDLKFESLN
jgi:hypothetical protein